MRKFLYLLFILAMCIACSSAPKKSKFSGGEISFPISSPPTSWIPSFAFDLNTQIILNQVFESLVEIDQHTYQVKPLIAKSFESNDDFTEFTFDINKEIPFHPSSLFPKDSIVYLTVNDIVKTIEYACSNDKPEGSYAYQNILKDQLKGAKDFHDGKTKTIEGLREEEGKLIMQLEKSDPLFLQKVASTSLGIFSSKWLENKQGIPPGTGPFYFDNEIRKNHIRLVRHENYFLKSNDNYKLPYLDAVNFKIYLKEKDKVDDFIAGKLDVVNGLNAANLDRIFVAKRKDFNTIPPKLVYFNNPLLQTSMLLFNLESPIFKSASMRKLFNHAINRSEINRKIVHSQADESKVYGLIPSMANLFNHYDYEKLQKESLDYNPNLVKKNSGELKPFLNDTLVLNVLDTKFKKELGEIVRDQLKKELGIEVRIQALTIQKMFDSLETMRGDLFLLSLSAEFMNPISIMKHFHGKAVPDSLNVASKVNLNRYQNWYYDQFYEKASYQRKATEQFNAILLAEKELLKNPPFIVLYYNSDNYIHNAYFRNLFSNTLNLVTFREVYKSK